MYFYDKGYGLHDTKVTRIKLDENKFVLDFDKGVYLIDKNGKENVLSHRCSIVIQIDNEDAANCIDIIYFSKDKYEFIGLDLLNKFMMDFPFDINDEFYSRFSKSIMLIGYIGKHKVEVNIVDVNNVSLSYY